MLPGAPNILSGALRCSQSTSSQTLLEAPSDESTFRWNTRKIRCSSQLENGINIARHPVSGHSVMGAAARSVIYLSFCWFIYITTFLTQSAGGKYATHHIGFASASVYFSLRGCKVLWELSEASGTPRCCWWTLGLLLIMKHPSFSSAPHIDTPHSVNLVDGSQSHSTKFQSQCCVQ